MPETLHPYLLPQSDEERKRLDLQQSILARIIPTYPTMLPSPTDHNVLISSLGHSHKILDSGVGSGSWILTMASFTSKASTNPIELIGIDIDLSKLPPPSSIPPHVSAVQTSVLDLPQEWANTFAYIHQTFLIIGLTFDSFPNALSQLVHVLQPGGWLALGEPGMWNNYGQHTRRLDHVLRSAYRALGFERGILDHLPGMLLSLSSPKGSLDASTISIELHRIPLAGSAPGLTLEQQQLTNDAITAYVAIFVNLRDNLLTRVPEAIKPFGIRTAEDYDQLMRDIKQEWENSEGCYMEFGVVCARKGS